MSHSPTYNIHISITGAPTTVPPNTARSSADHSSRSSITLVDPDQLTSDIVPDLEQPTSIPLRNTRQPPIIRARPPPSTYVPPIDVPPSSSSNQMYPCCYYTCHTLGIFCYIPVLFFMNFGSYFRNICTVLLKHICCWGEPHLYRDYKYPVWDLGSDDNYPACFNLCLFSASKLIPFCIVLSRIVAIPFIIAEYSICCPCLCCDLAFQGPGDKCCRCWSYWYQERCKIWAAKAKRYEENYDYRRRQKRSELWTWYHDNRVNSAVVNPGLFAHSDETQWLFENYPPRRERRGTQIISRERRELVDQRQRERDARASSAPAVGPSTDGVQMQQPPATPRLYPPASLAPSRDVRNEPLPWVPPPPAYTHRSRRDFPDPNVPEPFPDPFDGSRYAPAYTLC